MRWTGADRHSVVCAMSCLSNQVVYHLRKSKIFRGFVFSGKFKGKHNFHPGYLEKGKLIPAVVMAKLVICQKATKLPMEPT